MLLGSCRAPIVDVPVAPFSPVPEVPLVPVSEGFTILLFALVCKEACYSVTTFTHRVVISSMIFIPIAQSFYSGLHS